MIVDLFAGPGGWSEGVRALGLFDVGLEWDAAACSTRAAAGHVTIRADVEHYPPERFHGADGLIASPPCPDFSQAGNGAGRAGTSGHLIDTVPRWVDVVRPRWIACEQVPPALPIWHEHAAHYRRLGYRTWAGILNAADFGVPQTRRRAFLLGRLDEPVAPPEPTHGRYGALSLFAELRPWVSMADALGWHCEDTPARTLCGDRSPRWLYPDRDGTHGRVLRQAQRVYGDVVRTSDEPAPTLAFGHDAASWVFERPATTLAGDPRCWPPGHKINADDRRRLGDEEADERYGDRAGTEAIRLTVAQALILQSFRPDYPVQGTKTKQFEQVGNAVPPLLAAHVLAAVTGARLEAAA